MTWEDLKSIEEQNFRGMKQKIAIWEKAGLIDEIVGKIDSALEELDSPSPFEEGTKDSLRHDQRSRDCAHSNG